MYVIDSQKRIGENRQATIAQSDDQAQRRQEEESRRLELWASFVGEFCQEMAGAIVFWTAKMEGSPCRLTQGEEDPLSWRYSDLSVERTIALRGGPATSYAFTGHFQTAESGYRGEDSVESFRIVKDSSESPVVLVMRGTVFEGVNLTVRALVCWLITGGGAKDLVQWSPA